VKILHTSDWHLGARLHGLDRLGEQRSFLEWLDRTAREHRVDAMFVCGDIFDSRIPPPAAQKLYYDFLAERSVGEVVAIAGNHDSPVMLSAAGKPLRRIGVRVAAKAGRTEEHGFGDAVFALHGAAGGALAVACVPFMSAAEERNLGGFEEYCAEACAAARRLVPGAPVAALAHCTVSGARLGDSRSEAGRCAGGVEARPPAAFAGADYAALGHLHSPQLLDGGRIAYSGSPLPMSFAEAYAPKSVFVVDFAPCAAGSPPETAAVEVPRFVRFERFEGDAKEVSAALSACIAGAAGGRDGVFAALRISKGLGTLEAFWREVDAATDNTRVSVLLKEDVRDPSVSGAGAAGAPDCAPVRAASCAMRFDSLENATPVEIARMRLAEETLMDDGERAGYLRLVAEAAGGAS